MSTKRKGTILLHTHVAVAFALNKAFALSAGDVEYADCTSAKE